MSINQFLSNRTYRILFLLLVCYFSFFINNEVIYPDIMESRNLVTAREIVAEDSWLIPTMNGSLRLEKPPLPTWVAAAIQIMSPDNLPLQRAAAGLMASVLVFFLYIFATRQTGSRLFGMISAVSLCTSFNIILMGRTATWDIYCHAFMLAAIYFLFLAGHKVGKAWKEFLLAGLFMGLSFLGKGPVSFYALLLPFLVAWIWIYRPSFKGKLLPVLAMLSVCLLISFWWPILVMLTHKEMFLQIMDKESTAWLERNVRPWYYYWKFFAESGVWSLLLVSALAWPYWKKRIQMKKEYLFAVSWVFLILIFLSVLPEKKTRYLLPILIPSALVVAHFFMYYWEKIKTGALTGADRMIWKVNTFLLAGIVCLLPIGMYIFFYMPGGLGLGHFIFLVFILESVAMLLFYTAWKNKILSFLGGILMLFCTVEVFILPTIVGLFNNSELNSINAVREIEELENIPFYHECSEELRIEIVYEAGRKILPYCFKEAQTLPELPFVLVSGGTAEEIFPDNLINKVNLKLIDVYDDNKRPAGDRFHSARFVRRVTLVSKK